LVVCEGQTEKAYFDHLRQALRGAVVVKATRDKSSPQSVVDLAVKYRMGDAMRGTEADAYDEVWAAMDWDGRTDEVRQAMSLAARSGVKVALSNPCFEVWLLWHFTDFMATSADRSAVDERLSRLWPTYVKGKSADFAKLPADGHVRAIARACQAATEHDRAGRAFPDDLPSSGNGLLVQHIAEAAARSKGLTSG